MSDSDPPILGKFGEPPPPLDEHSLIFDPTAPLPLEEIEGLGYHETPRHSKALVFSLVTIGVIAAGTATYLLARGPQPIDPANLPSDMPTVAGLGEDTEKILPVPTADLQGPVGSSVRVAVRLEGRGGVAMPDTVVRFAVQSGLGILSEELVRSNQDGVASSSVKLPSHPAVTMVTAELVGSSLDQARILVTAIPGTPARLDMIAGNGQEASIGELLPSRVFVAVSDAEGNPVPNTEVRFQVVSGEGITAPSQTRTDSVGRASALWRLGMTEGTQRLTATASDLGRQISFSATALPRTTIEAPGDPPPVETSPVQIQSATFSVGVSHVCSLKSGVLSCRGSNDLGQAGVSGATRFVAVVAGAAHTCALDATGVASCWGSNESGQLGDGTRRNETSPATVRTELRFSTLAAGLDHTCGLAGGGVPLCWGSNLNGQLGDGTRNDQTVPRTVGGGMIFRDLVAGWAHTCGLTANGNAFCWGSNNHGQLGDGSTLDRLVPKLVRGAVERVVAGSTHTCGVSEGDILCWGANAFGQLGDGSNEDRSQPVPVEGLPDRPIVYLAAGAVHTCALMQGGAAYCWGQNLQGQLGDGTTENRSTAVPVAGGLSFSEIHAGGAQTCATASDGVDYCWGSNLNGQLGDGTRVNRSVPTRVVG